MKGIFIVLEGPDGSGKSTVIKHIRKYLEDRGIDVVETREPGGTAIGESIRRILLDNRNKTMLPETEALLLAAARGSMLRKRYCLPLSQAK